MPENTENIKDKVIAQTRLAMEQYKTLDLSLNMILEKSGVSKGSFYYHFKNRDDLIYQAVSPIIKKNEEIIRKKVLECENLRDKFHYLFSIFIDDSLQDELQRLEGMHDYLFFKGNINKSKVLKKICIEHTNKKQLIILQAIKQSGVKIDKEVKILVSYVIDTIMYYNLFYKSMYNKNPKREIMEYIDIICNVIESKNKN